MIFSRFAILSTVAMLCWNNAFDVKAASPVKPRVPISLATPMPDSLVTKAKKSANLIPAEEAVIYNSLDFIMRDGIDVSHYQGTIDWEKVAKEGKIGYAYMKASEGESLTDEYYEYNMTEARKFGIKVGSYHFFRANANFDAQFQNMTSTIRRDQQDIIPIVDVEHLNGVKPSVFVERLRRFLKSVSQHYGRKPLLYTFVNFYNKYLQGEGFDEYPLMIAFYREDPPLLNDEKRYIIWQYTSHGDVPGVHGNVDRSRIMDGASILDILY